jgi:hypothetical protein
MTAAQFWRSRIDAKQHGRITVPGRFAGRRRAILVYCQRIARLTKKELEAHYGWKLNRLDFFFLSKLEPTAVLLQHGERHGIGMCVGLPFAIVRHLEGAMTNPEFLENDVAAGERVAGIWQYLGWMIEHVFLHEAAHALRGHFDYLRLPHAKRTLDEQASPLNRYLELDADVHALDMWLAITEAAGDFPSSEGLLLDLYFQRVFTLLLLYQGLDTGNMTIRQQQRLNHPPPVHRALLLASAIRQTMPDRFGLSQASIENAHHQAFWEAGVAAKTAKLTEDRWWGGSTGRRRGIRSYRAALRRYLEDIEPKLDAFGASLPESLV